MIAGDPDITSDFIVQPSVTNVDSNFFTFTGMRILIQAPLPTAFKVTKASIAEFPALNGQSVSYAILQYPSGSVNPPHTIPAQLSSCFSLMAPFKLDLLTRQTSSLLRHSKLVTCLYFQKDTCTISSTVMQIILH